MNKNIDPNQAVVELSKRLPELKKRFGVLRIGVFGSRVCGQAREDSDIDILVDMMDPTFDSYMDLKFYLEDLFAVPVDLVLMDTIKPRIKPIILTEVVYA